MVQLGQYHGWRCPGSLRRQVISSNDTGYVIKQVLVFHEKGFQLTELC